MKAYSIVPFLLLAVASAQSFTPAKGKRPAPASKKDVTVDISDSAISSDFSKEPPPADASQKDTPVKEEGPGEATGGDAAGTTAEAEVPANTRADEPAGVSVRVEAGKSGTPVEAAKVKLLAPFPPKSLAKIPAGWRLERPENVPPLEKEVTLDNGTRIGLSIRPHVLIPEADGRQVIGVEEPGYDPALAYSQEKTMGAILSGSLERMDKDSKDLGDALERLQQLLDSLPHPAPAAPPVKPANSPR